MTEEITIFLQSAQSRGDIEEIWSIYEKADVGSPIKKKAAKAYLNLCSKPEEFWKLYSNVDVDEETKLDAKIELRKIEEKRKREMRPAMA